MVLAHRQILSLKHTSQKMPFLLMQLQNSTELVNRCAACKSCFTELFCRRKISYPLLLHQHATLSAAHSCNLWKTTCQQKRPCVRIASLGRTHTMRVPKWCSITDWACTFRWTSEKSTCAAHMQGITFAHFAVLLLQVYFRTKNEHFSEFVLLYKKLTL